MLTMFWMLDAQGVKSLLKEPSKNTGLLQIIQSRQHVDFMLTLSLFLHVCN